MALAVCDDASYYISGNGQEMINHGTPLFPVAFYVDDLAVTHVPWHWHEEMEVAVVFQGTALIAAGESKFTLTVGQGIFINSNELHAAWDVDHSGCVLHSIVFHPRLIGGGIDSIFWQDYLRPLISSGLSSQVFDLTESWHSACLKQINTAWQEGADDTPGYPFHVRTRLSELIFELCQRLPKPKPVSTEKTIRDSERIKTMLRFIQTNYSDEISVADIAKSASISESECLRCFHSTINISPIQYVKHFRVQRASEMLTTTDLKISDIGAQCGFLDTSYFTRSFREIKQMTPGEYRQKLRA